MHPVDLAEVESSDELLRLYPEWRELWARVPSATPFQSPDWLLPWWRHLGCGNLFVLTLRRGGRLVGIAPFCIRNDCEGRRRLLAVGNGVSDYFDALLEPTIQNPGAALLLAHLVRRADLWDTCDLRELPPEAALLTAPSPHGLADECSELEPCPVLTLPATDGALRDRVPAITLRNLRQATRRAAALGRVGIERAEPDTLPVLLEALFSLHASRWRERGQAGVLATAAVRAFHRDVAAAFLSNGVLRLYALRVGETIAAVYYGFLSHGRAYAYLSGFNPRPPRQSYGTLVIGHAIKEAILEGAREFDFLRGREAYKYAWGAVDRPNRCRTLQRSPR